MTIDGVRYQLSDNFTVLATQNPVEFEGTYPLPEAQLDRFLLKIRISYPAKDEEAAIIERYDDNFNTRQAEKIFVSPIDPALLAAARDEIQKVRVEPGLRSYIVSLIQRSRDWPPLSLGASPRAAIGLFLVARVLAGMEDRDYLIPDDIKAAALPVLRHRFLLKPEADLEGLTADQAVLDLLAAVEIPK